MKEFIGALDARGGKRDFPAFTWAMPVFIFQLLVARRGCGSLTEWRVDSASLPQAGGGRKTEVAA